jgi:hypothetical protein
MGAVTLEEAQAAKAVALKRFKKLDNVVGIGITRADGDYAVKLNLREPMPSGVELPSRIDGVPVRVEITGTIRARK